MQTCVQDPLQAELMVARIIDNDALISRSGIIGLDNVTKFSNIDMVKRNTESFWKLTSRTVIWFAYQMFDIMFQIQSLTVAVLTDQIIEFVNWDLKG